ncbi:biotin--[acetyl-CoA-carboxylase] ligase [Blautia sp. Sow4_E7]|uniref:biotin--[acetyl-CoA-carboxylase] ligase n=1 Tax=Blautia sp. Sow4_E7 TaxID=3438749 RepID=UPI003F930D2D
MKDESMTVKSRLLELLEQHKGETLSGEDIGRELSCTRAAVWKAVNSLRQEGYPIEAGPNKGYMLARESNLISAEGIRLFLEHPQVEVRIFDEISSTNLVARQMAVSGQAGHGSFVVAMEQTAGRGRRGREFYSPKGSGIYLSVILEPQGTLEGSLLITTAAATAVYKAVKEVCGVELGIKWVNDLYKENRKVCGILTEAVTDFESGNIEFAIVGIGLNLYVEPELFPEELQEVAGGIYEDQQSAKKADRNRLAAQIVNHLLEETRELKLSEEYVEHNIVPGNEITIIDNKSSRSARALSICPDGKLLVQESDGTQSKLSFGEISIKIPPMKK